ncbi:MULTISPECIES: hypothetical protein [unclassified Lactococcus]|uniref:hypothetical protein n=1 Tax=unclassified Lactococcus TaxID=2643510 RepID=UPI0011CC46C2|nr:MULTISPECIES: hypothetical protein [unclassified Lactococcus]MQW24055.1 hypothetical protein [Lactococcus sp. dk101]TXK36502.1 hypothetical protein FVP42_11235 [Lactococcus sp. dk310]TXK47163.1 hypothetical protein FVP43_10405 [Lactococcus sp. dk322]
MNNEDLMIIVSEYFLEEFPSDNPKFMPGKLGMDKRTLLIQIKKTISELKENGIEELVNNYEEALNVFKNMKPLEYEEFLTSLESAFTFDK